MTLNATQGELAIRAHHRARRAHGGAHGPHIFVPSRIDCAPPIKSDYLLNLAEMMPDAKLATRTGVFSAEKAAACIALVKAW